LAGRQMAPGRCVTGTHYQSPIMPIQNARHEQLQWLAATFLLEAHRLCLLREALAPRCLPSHPAPPHSAPPPPPPFRWNDGRGRRCRAPLPGSAITVVCALSSAPAIGKWDRGHVTRVPGHFDRRPLIGPATLRIWASCRILASSSRRLSPRH
jgi:hypothetical protein